jgi:NAD/NADP transhydrogenase beta subunit
MTNTKLTELGFEPVTVGEEIAITGAFCGDLLSWVMGRAQAGQVWFTVMGNINAVAVASLVGVAAVVICNDAEIEPESVKKAAEQGITYYKTTLPTYEAASLFHELFPAVHE